MENGTPLYFCFFIITQLLEQLFSFNFCMVVGTEMEMVENCRDFVLVFFCTDNDSSAFA